MEYSELKNKKRTELEKMLAEARGVLYDYRVKHAVNQVRDLHTVKKTKKMIARILTALSQEEASNSNN